ncbi:hypothetical protein Bhyg_07249 [Pseudolycoriella hygida]|uniref:Uncharacterized protein n=1 Tax=Pseudolycoriella hygida TaxID=35572 RepID=A0A9Q0N3B6_9DIPT|nr:hypothetical protein Bhyg_07249 [Pseudolycoriella hygida]
MGVLLSVLCSYMGALEIVFIVRDITHQLALHQMRLRNEGQSDTSELQSKIKASINALETVDIESVEQMQDGVLYKDGYRIENERSVEEIAQKWEERRKVLCVAELNTIESSPQSTGSNVYNIGNGIQNERTKKPNEFECTTADDESMLNDVTLNEQNNYRPIVRDDRSEEEENRNSSFTPINYSNDPQRNANASFHEKSKYDIDALSNKKPSSYHDSELWKRERATSIEEEREENLPTSSDKTSSRMHGTADKPTKETSCENEQCASHACELLDKVDTLCTLNTEDETLVTGENVGPLQATEPESELNCVIKKVNNLSNLNQYFNDAIESDESRDARSLTVYSRSISSDSNSTCNESIAECLRHGYGRTDSCSSFIQDELDSEEYHHNHRFSATADALEYIRGRDDWKAYTENQLNNAYRRQSSNISIREQIDSDEYHHERELNDLIEIAYLDLNVIQSLPSSFEENKDFDRYYFELQKIKGQLSNDIERNIAQKQVVLLDANQIEATEGYMYPLPHIIIDEVDDHDGGYYATTLTDSDFSNVSESEDDIQSVIEVNHDGTYAGEIITTLEMDGDDDEMIEVTLWDLNDDRNKEISCKESSVEIIDIPIDFIRTTPQSVSSQNQTTENPSTNDLSENRETEEVERGEINRTNHSPQINSMSKEEITFSQQTNSEDEDIEKSLIKTESPLEIKIEDKLNLHTLDEYSGRRPSTIIDITKSFIEHENLLPAVAIQSRAPFTPKTTNESQETKIRPSTPYENVDDLIKEGAMGVWFHK